MPKSTRQQSQNIFREARNKAGMTIFDAAIDLNSCNNTLDKIERKGVPPSPAMALSMAELYGQKELTAVYCSEVCPIGQKYAYRPDIKDLAQAVMGLLMENKHVCGQLDKLIEIASDNQVTDDERAAFEAVLGELMDMEQRIESVKLWAASMTNLSIEAMVQKRKATVLAAR
jgi:DNA-binding XRE family transcriptional regulator